LKYENQTVYRNTNIKILIYILSIAAVQIYNNPQVTFKAESFITLAVIGWTYLLHAFFRNKNIDYRYYHYVGKKKM